MHLERPLFSLGLWNHAGAEDRSFVRSATTMHHERSSHRKGESGVVSGSTGLTIIPTGL